MPKAVNQFSSQLIVAEVKFHHCQHATDVWADRGTQPDCKCGKVKRTQRSLDNATTSSSICCTCTHRCRWLVQHIARLRATEPAACRCDGKTGRTCVLESQRGYTGTPHPPGTGQMSTIASVLDSPHLASRSTGFTCKHTCCVLF